MCLWIVRVWRTYWLCTLRGMYMNTVLEGSGDPPVKSHLNLNLEEWSRFKLVHPNMYFWEKINK